MARINLSVDDEVLKRIDQYVQENGLTRSAFMTLASDQYIKAKTIEPDLKRMFESLNDSLSELKIKVDQVNAKN